MKNKLVFLTFLLVSSAFQFIGCGPLNNPFLPSAELSLTKISSSDTTNGVSVLQSFKKSGESVLPDYKFNEPTITIISRIGLPRVIFRQVIVEYTIANNKLPAQKFPIAITIDSGRDFTGPVPILALSSDLINSVFPNNTFASVPSGLAEVTLLGVDDNSNIIATKFSTPIRFVTDPANALVLGASPSPSSSSTPVPSPSGLR